MIKNHMKKLLFAILATIFISIPAHAQGISIIPEVNEDFRSNYSCTIIMKEFEQLYDFRIGGDPTSNQRFKCATDYLGRYLQNPSSTTYTCPSDVDNPQFTENDILGCSIITGRIRFAYVPRFIVYSLELLTILSGVLSLLFVILGGYYYLINSFSGSDTDKGKSYIKNAITGLILSMSAWAIINLIQLFFTS